MDLKKTEDFYFLTKRQKTILQKSGIKGHLDLLYRFPIRYENRGEIKSLLEVKEGEFVTVEGKVIAKRGRKSFRTKIDIVEALITDEKGNLHLIWFNQPWIEKSLEVGKSYYFSGRISLFSSKNGLRLQMENADFEEISKEEHLKIVPIYKKIGVFSSKTVRQIISRTLQEEVEEFLPNQIVEKENLPTLKEALLNIHFPKDEEALKELDLRDSKFIKRFIFQEFLGFEFMLLKENLLRKKVDGKPIRKDPKIGEALRKILPFKLTKSQKKVFREIVEECSSSAPMYRLLQGDVGSGKTIVAFLSMLWASLDGYQSAFMAPTETLAMQVYERLEHLAKKVDLKVAILISSTKKSLKNEILAKIKSGEIKLIVGTHALIQEKVEYKNLNFVVIDEQHRFGVLQRDALYKKGLNPHLLLMSATPIPRSLALTLYGDLNVSFLEEKPPNRGKVITLIRGEASRKKVEDFLKKEMDSNRQILYILPLIEESEHLDCEGVETTYKKFKEETFKNYRIGLLHGRLNSSSKNEVMAKMRNKELDMLVATTVIEVGIDLLDTSVIVIEHAERFGLAQLHQLRGRVGRGGQNGYCILMVGEGCSKSSEKRLRVLVESDDGFKIAEEDLKMRGTGEIFGIRQWGEGEFHFANPLKDLNLLESAREWANKILNKEISLDEKEKEKLKKFLKTYSQEKISYLRSG